MTTISLKNLEEATAQEVFDHVVNHLRKQGQRSLDRHGHWQCAYRGDNGLKCAAGCLIADDEYDASFEGNGWRGLFLEKLVPEAHIALIAQLQYVHDSGVVAEWEDEFWICAKKFNLEYTAP
jgi:hypothetical protein